jgi:hypothetical protein
MRKVKAFIIIKVFYNLNQILDLRTEKKRFPLKNFRNFQNAHQLKKYPPPPPAPKIFLNST